jgi:2-hydroxychromene-2-carboxylate isomerase
MTAPAVRFYFDFISPYSWLALTQAADMARRCHIRWDLRPVVYAKLLDAHGLLGPGETPVRRRAMYADVMRCAMKLGQTVNGPPSHPFRSLEALRVAILFRQSQQALDLCLALAGAAWSQGRDLTDRTTLAQVVGACGLDGNHLEARIHDPGVKDELRRFTGEAIDEGVFGVPTFIHDGELFWGHDRMAHLEDYLNGILPPVVPRLNALLKRPRGADRPLPHRRR